MCEAPFVCPKCSGYGIVEGTNCPVCNGERLIWPNPDLKNCAHNLKEKRKPTRVYPSGPYSRVPCTYCGLSVYRNRLERHGEICLFNPANELLLEAL